MIETFTSYFCTALDDKVELTNDRNIYELLL